MSNNVAVSTLRGAYHQIDWGDYIGQYKAKCGRNLNWHYIESIGNVTDPKWRATRIRSVRICKRCFGGDK